MKQLKKQKWLKWQNFQVLKKPTGPKWLQKSQGTNESVIFSQLEVSNEDFTICPYTPNILPTVPWHGLIVVLLLRISTL